MDAVTTENQATVSYPRSGDRSFAHKLDKLAEIAVRIGLNLAPGQEVVITAPLDAAPLVRRITEQAYRAGAVLVTTLFTDEESTLLRFRYAGDESFERAPQWLHDGIAAAYRSGAARLAVTGGNPALLANEDPVKVSRATLATSKANRPALELITRHEINWTIVAAATPGWAKLMFPDETETTGMARLWDAIFYTSRVGASDPLADWREHVNKLQARVDWLNAKRFHTIHFRSTGTDLRVGLADDHLWLGGATMARNGIDCVPNLPTEEVFTTPHKNRVDGYVTSTKPLSYQGTLIENIRVRFESGRIVEASASKGQAILENMIGTDDGARRLGEVALVPQSSPIASSGLLFWNTLFDENAASHIALGQAYSSCVRDGDTLDPAQLAERGANDSLIHVDWMIGSDEMDLDGLTADGATEPLMRKGEWVTA
jgi:aminopeptidase